jgi:hypothetical protein
MNIDKPVCGARTRKGGACQAKKLLRGGRCKLHGGSSTGPKSAVGKARARKNLRNINEAAAGAR